MQIPSARNESFVFMILEDRSGNNFQHCVINMNLMNIDNIFFSDCNSTSPVEVDLGPNKRVPTTQKAGANCQLSC